MGILVINKISKFVLRMTARIKPVTLHNYTWLIAIETARFENCTCEN